MYSDSQLNEPRYNQSCGACGYDPRVLATKKVPFIELGHMSFTGPREEEFEIRKKMATNARSTPWSGDGNGGIQLRAYACPKCGTVKVGLNAY